MRLSALWFACSLLLSPVDLIFGDKQITVDRDGLETWFKTGKSWFDVGFLL